MIFERRDDHPGARLLFIMACLVVVVYGLKFAAAILLPAALALFLAVLGLPVMVWLQRRGVPNSLSILITFVVILSGFGLIGLLASQSFTDLQSQLGRYVGQLAKLQGSWIAALEESTPFPIGTYITTDLVNPAALADFLRNALGRVTQFVTMTFLVLLIMAFMLGEATVFPEKLRYILGAKVGDEDHMAKVISEVQTYLGIKTMVSLATGVILGTWAFVMDLDFPVLLGIIAFLLNYVPTVGSIIAAVPAVLLSLILHGTLAHFLMVGMGYGVVNTLFGSILEPNLMGRRLGLSTLVVILSLLFWGWAWGPLGALLSVPLTMVVKIFLENTEDLRWIAVLLDKAPPPVPAVAGPANEPEDP